jgi:hypothetical protein
METTAWKMYQERLIEYETANAARQAELAKEMAELIKNMQQYQRLGGLGVN